jgi:C-terminal processing protease CtpA/Prc
MPLYCAGQSRDSVRIERLAGLGRLWGAIKYFHPYVADRDIDWDAALIQTIPKVESADSTNDYRQAIDFMLSFLNDPSTHTTEATSAAENKPPSGQPAGLAQPHVKWIDAQTALIVANDYSYFAGSFQKVADFTKVFGEVIKAKTIILDTRDREKDADEDSTFWYTMAFRETFPALLNRDVATASLRSRMFSGYPTQTGGYGDYYSAFVTREAQTIHGQSPRGATYRLVFIVNAASSGFIDILSGLQAAGLASIVWEGAADKAGGLEGGFLYDVTEGLKVTIGTSEFVNPDGSVGFHPDVVVPESADFAGENNEAIKAALRVAKENHVSTATHASGSAVLVAAKPENAYAEMKYPSREYRLLSLFRFWNVMFYFHAYRDLYDRPWDETLSEFIPQFEAAGNELEYAITTAKLVAQIDDTHGFMNSSVLQDYLGTGRPPVDVKSVEGKTVVTRIFDDTAHGSLGLSVGDVILSVDGEDIEARRQRLGQLFAASTPQALRWRVDRVVLLGPKDKPAELSISNAAGQVRTVSLTRASTAQPPADQTPVFRVLPEGFGYVDLKRLEPSQVDEAFEAVRNTTALIFDMRGYPKGVFPLLGARFAVKKTPAALFETPTPESPDPREISRVRFVQYAEPDSKWKYRGKVVVLINEDAISQAEHTCLFLEATAHAKFIGSPTDGANGDVTATILPGGITVNFSGHDVRHADGRQLQRVGIQPDIRVDPTIEGIRQGRDEVLERAISYLKSGQ